MVCPDERALMKKRGSAVPFAACLSMIALVLLVSCAKHETKEGAPSRGTGKPETTLPAQEPPTTPPPQGTTAEALLVGLTQYDPKAYAGDKGECAACAGDAVVMRDKARAHGFRTRLLTEHDATAANILNGILDATTRLHAGDTFLLMFSGHGGQLLDDNDHEPTGYDSTWCAFDREVLDDEIFNVLTKFSPNVRILVLSDSCHSGTIVFVALQAAFEKLNDTVMIHGSRQRLPQLKPSDVDLAFRDEYKYLPRSIARATYKAHKKEYQTVRSKTSHLPLTAMRASVVLLAASPDDGLAKQGSPRSTFTQAVLNTLDQHPDETLQDAFGTIAAMIQADQTPNYCALPPRDCSFENRPLLALTSPPCTAALKIADCKVTR